MEWKTINYDIDNHDYSGDTKWKLIIHTPEYPEGKPANEVNGYPIRYLKYKGMTFFIDSGDVLAPTTLMNLHSIMSLPNLIGYEDIVE